MSQTVTFLFHRIDLACVYVERGNKLKHPKCDAPFQKSSNPVQYAHAQIMHESFQIRFRTIRARSHFMVTTYFFNPYFDVRNGFFNHSWPQNKMGRMVTNSHLVTKNYTSLSSSANGPNYEEC